MKTVILTGGRDIEVGAAAGANLSMMLMFGKVVGREFDPPSQDYSVAK